MTKVVQRKDGRARVRMTVYLPPKLARALRMRAAETGGEMSAIVTAALEAMFMPSPKPMPPKPAGQSAPRAPTVTPVARALARPARDSGATTPPPPGANLWDAVTAADPWPSLEDTACWTIRQIAEYAAHRQKLIVASCIDKREQVQMDALVDRWVDDVVAKRKAKDAPQDQPKKVPK
jgi:hypothetical protein